MKKTQTVGLLIESSRAYGRGLLRGVARYVRAHHGWSVLHDERLLADRAPQWLRTQRLDGIIARVESREELSALRRLNVPMVDLRGLHKLPGVPLIATDDHAVARLAVRHLLDRGLRHFAFCGFSGADYSVERRRHFVALVREAGFEAIVHESDPPPRGLTTQAIEMRASVDHQPLARWFAGLPKPVGVMACNDVRGRHVLAACRHADIAIPEAVAVIGVDNDDVLCDLSDPPLSSVIPATERIGYEAAVLLARMMRGRPARSPQMLVEPLAVMTRQSSDVIAVDDPQVRTAIKFIREHVSDGINVEDILDHLAGVGGRAISRSTLERRFADTLGRSPRDEIIRLRIERARQLLIETDYRLTEVAARVGIEHAEQFVVMFKKHTGETPGAVRLRLGRPL
jgi:LacI family transcriptional regulator